MAPAAGTKRPAAASAGRPAKKAARDPVREKCDEVVAAVREAAHLSKECRSALALTVSSSLGFAVEERHEFQARVVEMIEATLTTCDENMVAECKTLEDQLAVAAETRVSREKAQADTAAQLEAKEEDCAAKKATLADCTKGVTDAKAALAAAKAQQQKYKKEMDVVTKQKEKYENAISTEFALILNGTWEDVKEAHAALKTLQPLVRELKVDVSMMSSLQSAVEKKSEDRGQFDSLVINQLGDSFTTHVTSLSAQVESSSEVAATHEREVDAATGLLEVAESDFTAAEEAYSMADAEVSELKKSLKAAEKAVTGFETEMRGIRSSKDAAAEALDEFRAGTLRAFKFLKERSAKNEEEEEEQVEGNPAEPSGTADPAA